MIVRMRAMSMDQVEVEVLALIVEDESIATSELPASRNGERMITTEKVDGTRKIERNDLRNHENERQKDRLDCLDCLRTLHLSEELVC